MARAADPDTDHEFGGPWTELKLGAITDYLAFFTMALKNKPRPDQPFNLWYVDAFAGSGDRVTSRLSGGIFDGRPVDVERVSLPGSAKRALAIKPPFKQFVFIEQNPDRHAALQRLAVANSQHRITCRDGEANEELERLFGSPPWSTQHDGRGLHRAVVFLDPYNMAVQWKTLKLLARTGAVDVWYLFPLNAVVRQLAHDFAAVDQSKMDALDEIFGTPDWRTELYSQEGPRDLFDQVGGPQRIASQRQIEAYAKKRLSTLFPQVSDALPLLTPKGSHLFSLFCACASTSPIAQALVAKGVASVLKKYGPASHRTSFL